MLANQNSTAEICKFILVLEANAFPCCHQWTQQLGITCDVVLMTV